MLVEVARFADLTEAEIAVGALRAHGLSAELFDRHQGSIYWIMHQAMGGFRIVAPESEHAEATALLAKYQAAAPPSALAPSGSPTRAVIAAVLAIFLTPLLGWMLVRRRRGLPDD